MLHERRPARAGRRPDRRRGDRGHHRRRSRVVPGRGPLLDAGSSVRVGHGARGVVANGASRGKGATFPPRGGNIGVRAPRGTAGLACRSQSSYGHRKSRGAVVVTSHRSTSGRSGSITTAQVTSGVVDETLVFRYLHPPPPFRACSFPRDPQEVDGRAWRSTNCQWPVP